MKKTKTLKVVSITLAIWGLLFISSGIAMNNYDNTAVQNIYSLNISRKKVLESKTNEIKLKEMKVEINTPLSVDIRDYLENIEKIDKSVLDSLKLDTSAVKTDEAGTYTYTITYKKKKYNGTFIITEKELPKVNFTLKNLTLELNASLSADITTYVNEKLDKEVIDNIVLDTSNVNTKIIGIYQYTITYGNKIYTANIEIIKPKVANNEEPKEEVENTEDKKDTENKTEVSYPNTNPEEEEEK